MRINKKRAVTIALVAAGLAIAALGTTMFLVAPSSWPFPGHMGNYYRDGTLAPDADRGAETYFVPRGPGLFRGGYYGMGGPGSFMGGTLVLLGFVGLCAFIIKRRHGGGFHGSDGASRREEDALGILRREFAEGRLSEEEYKHRLEVLQE